MAGRVFVDSTAWIALLHSGDSLHSRAKVRYQELVDGDIFLVTTSLVLVEVANALAAPHRRALAVELERRCRESRICEVIWIGEDLHARAWQLYRERPDKGWSFVDCTSFLVMRDAGITEALTADQDFEQAGFIKLV